MSETEKSELDKQYDAAVEKAEAANKERSGVGTRQFVGKTRGKNPQVITYENFDTAIPDSLPKSLQQFTDVTKTESEQALIGYLIAGYNEALYTAASDPLAEFVEKSWPDDAQNQFRIVVRNYAKSMEIALEEAVELIKPGFVKKFGKD